MIRSLSRYSVERIADTVKVYAVRKRKRPEPVIRICGTIPYHEDVEALPGGVAVSSQGMSLKGRIHFSYHLSGPPSMMLPSFYEDLFSGSSIREHFFKNGSDEY